MSKLAEPYVRWHERHASPKDSLTASAVLLGVILVVIGLVIAAHVLPALASHGNPPLTCQLLGGHWDIWDGWRCG